MKVGERVKLTFEDGTTKSATVMKLFGSPAWMVQVEFEVVGPGEDAEACPGCGCLPGEGVTRTCNHHAGCGFHKAMGGAEVRE